ncbi:hypothetical protein H0H92_010570 [Tricholoma furcatifolium]|nr:hypothetical protein H0H92_010570 [Tricholoma furcatifolium]
MAFAGVLSSSVRLGSSHLRSAGSRGHQSLFLALTTRNITQDATKVQVAAATPVDAATTAATLPAVPSESLPVEETVGILDTVVATHLPAAMQYGDLAALGLAGWTPAGLVRWSMELINVSTGMPWFWTIIAGSLLWRAILFPISVKSLQNSARLLPIQGTIQKYQQEMQEVRMSGDKLALQRLALKMRKTYKDAGVSMGATALVPFVQIPVTLGLFFGVKKMCELPVMQLMNSGVSFLPDLTVADPYMALPILLCAAVNLQIHIGAAEMDLQARPEMGHLMNGLRLLSVAGIYVMSSFPSGLVLSLLTTSTATTLQSYLMQQPKIRSALNIPIVPSSARGRLPTPTESVQYVIGRYRAKVAEAQAAQRKR